MGRRKKEPESVHREAISSAAERLFLRKGFESATMDDIAREAGYSKATLYVYFNNKEDIIGFLVCRSMKLLFEFIRKAVREPVTVKEKYNGICKALTIYQDQYPLYFNLALGEINVDFERGDCLPEEKETFEIGEQINAELVKFIQSGIAAGEFLPDIPVLQTVFLFWASLAGVIQMAVNKQAYIEMTMHQTKSQFLEFGFERLYRLISAEGENDRK
ncbi:TetR/AcrR family transcriptional regulator [Anaerolentibacter hominis]|uniref:TetR/AcrR family transcriptional regulator n=1 Tax=Anaerolentibacter hominis TaxID=3079009 RepID=UPI0031B8AD0E